MRYLTVISAILLSVISYAQQLEIKQSFTELKSVIELNQLDVNQLFIEDSIESINKHSASRFAVAQDINLSSSEIGNWYTN